MKKLVLYSLALSFCSNATAQDKSKYKNNIISFSPLQINNPGVGFGLSYECDLDKKGIVSLYLPVSFSFASDNSGYYASYKRYYTGFWMPGLKFYPAGSKGKVKYAIGPNLGIVLGQRLGRVNLQEPHVIQNRFSLGTMLFNSLNINPTPHLNMGFEMGMGVSYIDQADGVSTSRMPFLFQLGAKVGYRF